MINEFINKNIKEFLIQEGYKAETIERMDNDYVRKSKRISKKK